MAASERRLTPPAALARHGLARTVLSSYGLLWAGALLAAVLTLPLAGQLHGVHGLHLAPSGGARMAAVIAVNNAREAAIPMLFSLLRVRRHWVIVLGDFVVGGCLAANVALGGVALGTYGVGLLCYLPHWPLEWAAFALALTAWRRSRNGTRDPCELLLLALACASLLCAGALIETYTIPQT